MLRSDSKRDCGAPPIAMVPAPMPLSMPASSVTPVKPSVGPLPAATISNMRVLPLTTSSLPKPPGAAACRTVPSAMRMPRSSIGLMPGVSVSRPASRSRRGRGTPSRAAQSRPNWA